ncbi:MAG TPA: type II toxin-antitoxin system RelE/ParE family toxin [Thermoanaerobaculia bacterium]|nr:type II toxin-antitoxin system RelE/ParE family toxin [Thermoanaerobaculia bacterium]
MSERIAALAADPRPPGCRKLFGLGRYGIRVGTYRVIYQVDEEERIVDIVKIGHRRDVDCDR